MRPQRLELEGFASFKQRTVIDFEGADLFVLTGPMGSGKSSIIDAIGFALYGSVARYDRRTVAPVISQGLPQARVRLDFTVGGVEYTAARVVRRTPSGGATTPDARLIRGEELIAGTADEVTAKVEEVLGLSFEQFTKCVVLPQGEFADLLHAKAAERQDILARLLDVTFYRSIGQRARERAAVQDELTKSLRGRIERDLADATEANLKQARRFLATLEGLLTRFDADEGRLKTLEAQAQAGRNAAVAAETLVAALRRVQVPLAAIALGERRTAAAAVMDEASQAAIEADSRLQTLEAEKAGLPERTRIESVIAGHEELAALSAKVEQDGRGVAVAVSAAEEAAQRLGEAEAASEAAQNRFDEATRADAAYHAAGGLKAGDVCPVCGERLSKAPKLAAPAGLAPARKAAEQAKAAVPKAEALARGADRQRLQLEASLAQAQAQRRKLAAQLESQPPLAECRELLDRVTAADEELGFARAAQRSAKQALAEAQAELDAIREAERQLSEQFDEQRNPVAALGASRLEPGQLLQSWVALAAWAAEAAAEQEKGAAEQRRLADEALAEAEALLGSQRAACDEAGVETGAQRPRDAALNARGRAEQAVQHLGERLEERHGLEEELSQTERSAKTAATLGRHLSAPRFEKWYLQEALRRLVQNASLRLQELTSGQYSLDLNDAGSDFVVVDHINANEMRSARSLSGGETFLASLALALALGEDVAELDAGAGARLESLLLDEGFGTLDPDTLETVASTIEELGARGRMVGIVTHVPELAQRIPVQFRVSKERGSSRVERVESG